ncbi:MAG: hypothetical protein JNL97_13515, partial [Verrucomicrobiales bacterium]|nr:hypothetical protein [Verrucomicrobiales bacterium]
MNQDPSRAPGHRPGWLIGIVVVIALGMLLVRSQEDLDANIRAWFVSLLVVLGLLLTLLWFLFL